MSLLPVALVLVGLWLVLPAQGRALVGWKGGLLDLVLAVASGAGMAWAFAAVLAPVHLDPSTYVCTDFHEYCGHVAALVLDQPRDLSPQRSALAGWPAAVMASEHGLVDGMALAGVLSTAALGTGLYLWARALADRVAGVAAVVLAGTLVPLVALSHTLSLYDEMAAAFTLGAAGAAIALRWRTPLALLLGGLGAGLCFLVDLRGLFWGLSFVGLCGLAALWPRPGRGVLDHLGRVMALSLPLVGAWLLGARAYGHAQCLEVTMNPEGRMRERGLQLLPGEMPEVGCYVWGRTGPLDLPDTLHWVWAGSQRVPAASWQDPEVLRNLAVLVGPLQWLVPFAAGLVVLGCVRGSARLPRLVALVGTAVPFVAALSGAIKLQRAQLHYLGNVAPLAAVLLGLAVSTLVLGLSGIPRVGAAWRGLRERLPLGPAWTRAGVALGLVLAVVAGWWPTTLAPDAAWRRAPFTHSVADMHGVVNDAITGFTTRQLKQPAPSCTKLLRHESATGGSPGGTLWGGLPARLPPRSPTPPR